MKNKRFLMLLLSGIMSVCLLCTGCMPGAGTSIDSGDIDSGTGGGGGSGGSGGDVPPVYEANNFSSNIYALVNRQGNEGVFEDYYRRNVSFNELVDRQIGLVATEIIERLNDIYGSGQYKYSFDSDEQNYTTWQVGKARGDKYQVHILGDVVYVFVLDKNGEYILDDNGYPLKDTGKNYRAVYYVSDEDNNMDDYIGNPSCQALASYLLNGGYSDTYLDNQTGYDVNEQKLSVLAGSIYGDNTYVQYDNEIVVEHGQYDKSWLWSSYFANGTSVNRLKYNLAKIIVNNTSVNQMTDTYGSDYDSLLSQIPYLANYLDYYYDEISYFVTNYVVGSDLIMQDNNAISTLQNVLAKSKDYRDTFEYALNDVQYEVVLRSIADTGNYNLKTLYEDCNLFENSNVIPELNKTFEDEYNYLILDSLTGLKENADVYKDDNTKIGFIDYYNLYYGINESDWIDEEQTVRSFNQIEFPYTWERIVASRNYKNYETVIEEVLHSVQNQTFDTGTHAVITNPSYKGYSAFAEMGRVGRDSTITNIHQFGDITVDGDGNEENTYTKASNYRSIIIPAIGNIPDLSHYSLLLCVGDNIEEMSIRVSVQLVDSTGQGEVLVLDKNMAGLIENYPYPEEGMAGGSDDKFIVPQMGNDEGMGNNTWFIEFDLPTSSTTISMAEDEEPFSYGEQSLFDNDFVLEYDEETGEVTYSIVATNCIVITFEVFDASGRELPAGKTIPFGVSLWLDNYHEKEQ